MELIGRMKVVMMMVMMVGLVEEEGDEVGSVVGGVERREEDRRGVVGAVRGEVGVVVVDEEGSRCVVARGVAVCVRTRVWLSASSRRGDDGA